MPEPCEPGALCVDVLGTHLALTRQNAPYLVLGILLFALLLYSYWPRPEPPKPPKPATPLECVELEIAEGCASVSSITTGIFVIALLLSVLRPDPTPAVTLFGFYGPRRTHWHRPTPPNEPAASCARVMQLPVRSLSRPAPRIAVQGHT